MCTLDVIFSSKVQEKGTASSVAGCLLGAHSGAHCTSDKRFFFRSSQFSTWRSYSTRLPGHGTAPVR